MDILEKENDEIIMSGKSLARQLLLAEKRGYQEGLCKGFDEGWDARFETLNEMGRTKRTKTSTSI